LGESALQRRSARHHGDDIDLDEHASWPSGKQSRGENRGGLPAARDQHDDVLQVESALWRPRGGGGAPAEDLEDENRRLKKLDVASLKDLLAKNVWSAPPSQG
jgi:hypothetical protein